MRGEQVTRWISLQGGSEEHWSAQEQEDAGNRDYTRRSCRSRFKHRIDRKNPLLPYLYNTCVTEPRVEYVLESYSSDFLSFSSPLHCRLPTCPEHRGYCHQVHDYRPASAHRRSPERLHRYAGMDRAVSWGHERLGVVTRSGIFHSCVNLI